MTHEEQARNLVEAFIASSQDEEFEIAAIATALRDAERETWEKAAAFIEQHYVGYQGDAPWHIIRDNPPGEPDVRQRTMAAALRAEAAKLGETNDK